MKHTYTKNNITIHYVIHYKKIKHTYFRVKDDYLYVTTNKQTKKEVITNFIDRRFDDIVHKINKKPIEESIHHIDLWGKSYIIDMKEGNFSYYVSAPYVHIKSRSTDINAIKKMIYKFEMIKHIESIKLEFSKHIAQFNMVWLPYKLKYMKSKFGSYNRNKYIITLNTYLARLHPDCLLYILNHEYAHTKVFNHQNLFYHLLQEMCPNYKQIQKDLKKIAIS